MTQDTTQSALFPDLFPKPVSARFDQPDSSSDGSAILLKAIDTEMDLTKRLAQCIQECRQEAKVLHPLFDLFRQRVYGIACGYPDCNDADRLADDPIQKLLLDRDPIDGKSPASLPDPLPFQPLYPARTRFVPFEPQHLDLLSRLPWRKPAKFPFLNHDLGLKSVSQTKKSE